jgi:hypothetical protein
VREAAAQARKKEMEMAVDALIASDDSTDPHANIRFVLKKCDSGEVTEEIGSMALERCVGLGYGCMDNASSSCIQYVRLEHSNQYIHVQQVEVYDTDGNNWALVKSGAKATASSGSQADPNIAIDGNTDAKQGWPNSCCTNGGPSDWWEVDLGREIQMDRVVVYNRPDTAGDRLKNCRLKLLNGDRQEVYPKRVLENVRQQEFVDNRGLNLSSSSLGRKAGLAIAKFLEGNTRLERLDLKENDIGSEAIVAIARSLETNKTLQKLFLLNTNGVWPQPVAPEAGQAFAKALEVNTTLRLLDIQMLNLGKPGIDSIGRALEKNSTLQNLFCYGAEGGQHDPAAILEALKKRQKH